MTNMARGNTKHGGRRKGAGRKPLYQKRQHRRTITLPDEYTRFLSTLGCGNLSAGVRRLVEAQPSFGEGTGRIIPVRGGRTQIR